MSKEQRQYTVAFKRDTIALVTELGCKVCEAARSLGINDNILRRRLKNEWSNSGDEHALHDDEKTRAQTTASTYMCAN